MIILCFTNKKKNTQAFLIQPDWREEGTCDRVVGGGNTEEQRILAHMYDDVIMTPLTLWANLKTNARYFKELLQSLHSCKRESGLKLEGEDAQE